MKIVVKNNRVLAHGGEYIALGSTVIDTESQKVFTDATIAECENCPPDIDSAGYEYRGGEFVPCAPYGVGTGNVAVVCNESCKSIKDSGFSIDTFAGMEVLPYKGTGTEWDNAKLTLKFETVEPTIIFFQQQTSSSLMVSGYVCGEKGVLHAFTSGSLETDSTEISAARNGKEITLSTTHGPEYVFNRNQMPYIAVAFGKRVN